MADGAPEAGYRDLRVGREGGKVEDCGVVAAMLRVARGHGGGPRGQGDFVVGHDSVSSGGVRGFGDRSVFWGCISDGARIRAVGDGDGSLGQGDFVVGHDGVGGGGVGGLSDHEVFWKCISDGARIRTVANVCGIHAARFLWWDRGVWVQNGSRPIYIVRGGRAGRYQGEALSPRKCVECKCQSLTHFHMAFALV